MNENSQKGYDLYEKMAPILNNLQSINNNFDLQRKQISNLNYAVDKMNLDIKNRELDQKNIQWLYSLQERENKLQIEIQQHESKKAQLDNLKKQLIFYEEQIQTLTNDNNRLRLQLTQIQQKNEQLIASQDIALRESIKEVNESFISRIVQLEAQLQSKQKDEIDTGVKLSQLVNQVKLLESQKSIFKEECEQFEIMKDTIAKEKEMYLNEFRYLKENYLKAIDKLEEEIHKLKVSNHHLGDQNNSLKQEAEYYKNRFQDMMDLQELASLNQDQGLLSLLKSKGMVGITKTDIEQVRDDTFKEIKFQQEFKLSNTWDQVMNEISKLN